MAGMPVGGLLKCNAGGDQHSLRPVFCDELEADRKARSTVSARQGYRRMTRQIEWSRVTLQLQNELRLRTQGTDRRQIERRERMHRCQENIDVREQSRKPRA